MPETSPLLAAVAATGTATRHERAPRRRRALAVGLMFAILSALLTTAMLRAVAPIEERVAVAQDPDPTPALSPEAVEARESFDQGHDAWITGSYRVANRYLKRALKTIDEGLLPAETYARAAVCLARSEREGGDYDDALEVLDEYAAYADDDNAWLPVLVEKAAHLQHLGRYDALLPLIARLREAAPADPNVNFIAGYQAYLEGREDDAEALLTRVTGWPQANRDAAMAFSPDEPNPALSDKWISVGKAYYYKDLITRFSQLRSAHESFKTAMRAWTQNTTAYYWIGKVTLETTDHVDAREDGFKKALEINPLHVPSLCGLGETWMFQWASSVGAQEIEKAMQANDQSLDALLGKARVAANDQRYDIAWDTINTALQINPNSLDLLSAKALFALQTQRHDEFPAIEARVLEMNPVYSEFYRDVAQGLMDQHRFLEALEACKKGLALDERDWQIYTIMGFCNARLGRNGDAYDALVAANRNDTLRNKRFTLNMLQVLRIIREEFAEITSSRGRFIIRGPKNEMPVMGPLLDRFLETSFDSIVDKYGWTPETPLVFEFFDNHTDFEVRSVGLPGLPALGVCFGHYITMDSPSAREPGQFSWAKTARHELDHVFQIQMSKGRVPRWLAEGCSVFEERRTRPEWDREMDQQMIQFYWQGRLMKVAEANRYFRNMGTIMFAYYQSSYFVEYIATELGGYLKISELLQAFGRDASIGTALEDVFGITPLQFDEGFHDFVKRNFIEQTTLLPFYGSADLLKFKLEYEDRPEDPELRAKLGAAYLHNGNRIDAKTHAGVAMRLDPNNATAIVTMAHIYFQEARTQNDPEKFERAKELYEKALMLGIEDFFVYFNLAQLTPPNAWMLRSELLQSAKSCFPRYVGPGNPYLQLAQLFEQSNRTDAALAELEAYVAINELDIEARSRLANHYEQAGDLEKARLYLEQLFNLVPLDFNLTMRLGEVNFSLEDYAAATFKFQLASNYPITDPSEQAMVLWRVIDSAEPAKLWAEGVAACEQLLALQPDDQQARLKRNEFQRKLDEQNEDGN